VKRRHNDLVVLGTRGLNKAQDMLLGSVSRKLLNLCKVNCLVVR
jgi:nucleotide-binding universal stress UspA family protein